MKIYVFEKILTPGDCLPTGYIHVHDHYFQTSSLKLLGQSKPNLILSLLGKGERKFGPGHMTKMATMPIHVYGKILKRLFLWSQKSYDLETWLVASGTQALQILYE